MAGIIHLRLHSFGNLEFMHPYPHVLQAGLGGDIINFVLCVVAFFLIGYFVAYFMIGQAQSGYPGARLGNYTDDNANDAAADTKTEKKADKRRTTVRPSASSPCWAAGRTSCWWMPA